MVMLGRSPHKPSDLGTGPGAAGGGGGGYKSKDAPVPGHD